MADADEWSRCVGLADDPTASKRVAISHRRRHKDRYATLDLRQEAECKVNDYVESIRAPHPPTPKSPYLLLTRQHRML